VRRVLWFGRQPNPKTPSGAEWVPCAPELGKQLEQAHAHYTSPASLLAVYAAAGDKPQCSSVQRGRVACCVHDGDSEGLLQLVSDGEGGPLSDAAAAAILDGQKGATLYWDPQAWERIHKAAAAVQNYRGQRYTTAATRM
jgi:hypothetical protein